MGSSNFLFSLHHPPANEANSQIRAHENKKLVQIFHVLLLVEIASLLPPRRLSDIITHHVRVPANISSL